MENTLIVRQHFDISTARLFQLLSQPMYLEQWFSPSPDIEVNVMEHEFQLGGKYRLQYTQPDGSVVVVCGEFTEIEPGSRISFTWTWQKPDVHADIPTLVTWVLVAKNLGTELTVLHQKIPDSEFHQRHKLGWLGAMDRLSHI